MEPTVNSMHFLWGAYLLVAGCNIAFVAWIASSWAKLNRSGD